MTARWTHNTRNARDRKGRFHAVDPCYKGNGRPAWWACYVCGGKVRLNGDDPPVATPVKRRVRATESAMSAQP